MAPAFWGIAAGYRESPDTTASRCRSAGGGYAAGRSAAGPGTGIATGGYEDGSEGRRRYVWPGEHRATRQGRGGQQPEYRGYIDTALALKDLGFRLEEIKPLARLALGRSVSAGQRDMAARLVDDRIEALARQASVLRRLRDSVKAPDAATAVPGVLTSVDLSIVAPLHGDGAA